MGDYLSEVFIKSLRRVPGIFWTFGFWSGKFLSEVFGECLVRFPGILWTGEVQLLENEV
jgi:hypothetical protein